MTSTLNNRKDGQRHPLPPGYTQNGGTHIPLGSEGSSRDSEMSSGGELEGQLPETVDIEIVFPDKNTRCLTVDYGKQMMDLLVQVTASHRMSPATHTFLIYSEETGRPVEYYASQPVGSLGITTLHLIEKKKTELQRKREKQSEMKSSVQPFEITHRLTVNLPKNQKMITRVSPKSTLADIYKMVCSEKNLDPYKYELRHPIKPDEALNMASPLGDYQLVEITVVPVGPESRHSISQLSLDSTDLNDSSTATTGASVRPKSSFASYSTSTMEKKKKKGLFSLFSKKKEGKFKVSEATYNASTSTLPSGSGGAPLAGSSHMTNNYPTSSSSLKNKPQKGSSQTLPNNNNKDLSVSNKVRDEDYNNVSSSSPRNSQHFAPPKPPRKKRQAPLPPPQCVSTNQEGLTTTNHSRGSSHSSGFESAGSPIESPGTSRGGSSTTQLQDNGQIISTQSQPMRSSKDMSVRPKEPSGKSGVTGTRKKRRAPAPPGVSRLRVGSESSDVSTPASTPRYKEVDPTTSSSTPNLTEIGDEGGGDENYLIANQNQQQPHSSPRPNPVFMPPPPPDTPPPSSDEIPPSLDISQYSGSGVIGQVEVADSSTQVHVTNRDSLSSDQKSVESPIDMKDESLTAITSSRQNSVASDQSVISIGGAESLELENPVYIDPTSKSDVAEFVDRMSILTEKIELPVTTDDVEDNEKTPDGLSPRSALSDDHSSFTKDSLRSSSSETVSVDNYDFGIPEENDIEPALPATDTSVVLIKKKILPDDSFYTNDSFTVESTSNSTSSPNLTESNDSGIGTLTKPPKEFEDDDDNVKTSDKSSLQHLKSEEETELPVSYVTQEGQGSRSVRYSNDENADKYSVDSLDILETPTSDSGISGTGATNSLERDFCKDANSIHKSLAVTEEITIDQNEVMYVAPGGPKPDMDEEDKSKFETEKVIENNELPVQTFVNKESPVKSVVENTGSLVKSVDNKELPAKTVNNEVIVSNQPISSHTSNTTATTTMTGNYGNGHEPQMLIIEKPKLSQDISNTLKHEIKAEEKQRHLGSAAASEYRNMKEADLDKLMSYVESAKMKSGDTDGPRSPTAESTRGGGSTFFVEVGEKKPPTASSASGLQSRSLDSFGSYHMSYYDTEKPKMTVTAVEIRKDSRPSTSTTTKGSFGIRDTYQKPVSSLREAYGKTVNREPEFNFKSTATANTTTTTAKSPSKTPAYSFYRTVESSGESVSGRRSKEPVENKRHSTIIMASRADKVNAAQQKRRSEYFMGPRPWVSGGASGRQNSEPSVRDVRKALAINDQRSAVNEGRDSPLNKEVEDINSSVLSNGEEVREQCSKIGFEPRSEQESDSVLEEKSISLINLPASRKAVMKPRQSYQTRLSGVGSNKVSKSESMENVSNLEPRSPTNKMVKSTENVFDVTLSARDKSRKTLQTQYDELQQQFSKWQEQLMDNQALLSKRTSAAGSRTDANGRAPSNLKSASSSQFDRRRTIDVLENSANTTGEMTALSVGHHQPVTQVKSLDIDGGTDRIESRRIHQGPRYGSLTEGIPKMGTEGIPKMGTNSALANKFSSDELAQARIKLRQNSDDVKGSQSMRFNADGSTSRINRASYGGSLSSEPPTSPRGLPPTSLPQHSTPLRDGNVPLSYNEPSSPTSVGVTPGFHARDQTRKYGARVDRKKVSPQSGKAEGTSAVSSSRSSASSRFEPQLDPREELMIAIRNAGGRNTLRTVTVGETHWVQGADSTTF